MKYAVSSKSGPRNGRDTHLDGIVEDFGGRVQHEVLQRHDFRGLPAAQATVIGDLQHVVGEVLAENEIVGLWLRVELMRRCQSHRQLRVLRMKNRRHTTVHFRSNCLYFRSSSASINLRKIKQKLMNSTVVAWVRESRIVN